MPVSVPTVEDLQALIVRVKALEDKQLPIEVKDALLVVLNWLTTQS